MTELTEAVLHGGRWYDEVLMSVLDHEWAARRELAGERAVRPRRDGLPLSGGRLPHRAGRAYPG